MEIKSSVHVTVIYSPGPRYVHELVLELVEPATVLQAVQCSGLLRRFPEIDNQRITLGIWGRKTTLAQTLRDQDRIEIYRPLQVDPKVARRVRFVKQGARAAGLFVKKRVGSKAGY